MALTRDKFDRVWDISPNEQCPECGQPDSCGDCNHVALAREQLELMRGSPGLVETEFWWMVGYWWEPRP